MSVKGGCIEGLDWSKAIHIWTKSAMVPIPEGSEAHSEESGFSGYSLNSSQEDLDQPGPLIGSDGCERSHSDASSSDVTGAKMSGACELSG